MPYQSYRRFGAAVAVGLLLTATWAGTARAWPISKPQPSESSGFAIPKIPNPFEALASGARKAADGIKGLFNGHKDEPQTTGYYNPNGPHDKKPAKQESSFFGLFKKKEPKRVETVSDWMALEPVRP